MNREHKLSFRSHFLSFQVDSEKVMIGYSVRPKSITDLRRHFKKNKASTFFEERIRAMEHPLFKRHIGTTTKVSAQWATHAEEKDNLTDLRIFLAWLHDESKDLEHPAASAVKPSGTLDEMANVGEAQAGLDSTTVPQDPQMSHLPNPAEDARAMLKGTLPSETTEATVVKRARTLADVKSQRQASLSSYAAKGNDKATSPKTKTASAAKAFEI